MKNRKRSILMAAIVAIVSTTLIIGTVSAFVYIKHAGELPITVHRSNTTPTPAASTTENSKSPAPLPDGDDWTQYRFDVKGTGMNPEGLISKQNVSQLTRQWAVKPNRAFGSTPAVVNGQVYVTNGNSLFDIDLDSGETIWRFDDTPQPHGAITSSVAVDSNTHMAYYGTPDARVYAVNILTGKEVWDLQIGNENDGAFIWSSPLLVNGKVYIGLASHDDNPCVRGGVFAFNAATGNVVWKHYMTSAGTLGGGVWSSLIAVPSAHELIATTGNPCPHGVSGDEEDSFVAMNWDTGATLWQYTAVHFDDCDCDFGEGAVDFSYHGQEYVVAGNKNGTVYALAPSKGNHSVRLVWSLKISKSGFLNYGGIFQPPTYSNGTIFVAGGPTADGLCPHGMLYTLQADTGAIRWSTCTPVQVVSPTSTTGDVLFVETGSTLLAYSSATGQELWRAQQSGEFWGGISISRGSVLVAGVSGTLYRYSFTKAS
jgi:alcohol dehydrogenase (cytochrome c)